MDFVTTLHSLALNTLAAKYFAVYLAAKYVTVALWFTSLILVLAALTHAAEYVIHRGDNNEAGLSFASRS